MTRHISALRGRHAGEAVTILGRAPSLARLREVPPGPVIALNAAVVTLRTLAPTGPVYTMQKDGCYTGTTPLNKRRPCGGCPRGHMVTPKLPEALLVSRQESRHCFRTFPKRYVFDPAADFHHAGSSMSSPMAVYIALLMGAGQIVMISHDAYTNGDGRFMEPDGSLHQGYTDAYIQAATDCDRIARAAGVPIGWFVPPE